MNNKSVDSLFVSNIMNFLCSKILLDYFGIFECHTCLSVTKISDPLRITS